jgi:hypothetical protein
MAGSLGGQPQARSGGSFFRLPVYPSRMSRRASLVIVPSCLLLFLAGCTQVREFPASRLEAPEPSPEPPGGAAMVAIPFPQTVFGPSPSALSVQPGTLRLKGLIVRHPRLKVTALPSTNQTVALGFQEKARGKQRWGGVMIPQERRLFLRFAQDPSLGEWLIVITDVDVTDAPDPIPLVAYRWTRPDVEAYAKCGIPQSVTIDECTETFYRAPKMIFLMHQRIGQGQ